MMTQAGLRRVIRICRRHTMPVSRANLMSGPLLAQRPAGEPEEVVVEGGAPHLDRHRLYPPPLEGAQHPGELGARVAHADRDRPVLRLRGAESGEDLLG